MTRSKLGTVLVGFGKIGAGYAEDPVMARYYPYATHAQVLAVHPDFAWEAVVDISDEALELARNRWKIPHLAKSVEELTHCYQPEVAVIATPPESRSAIIEQLPTLCAVMVEKPVGLTVAAGQDFLDHCNRRRILVQVNLWRRADETFRSFAAGKLGELVGQPQAVFGVYGNGLLNNGTHMVDLVRMLFGEIETVQSVGGVASYTAGPIVGDVNVPFTLRLCSSLTVMMQPIRFEDYRENSLDIWGEKARLSIMQEGLGICLYPQCENRAMQGEREIASDQPQALDTTVGQAFYNVYSNLADAVNGEASLWSPGESALQTARVIEAVMDSARRNDVPIALR